LVSDALRKIAEANGYENGKDKLGSLLNLHSSQLGGFEYQYSNVALCIGQRYDHTVVCLFVDKLRNACGDCPERR